MVILNKHKNSKMVAKGDFGKYEVGLFLAIFGIFGVISSLIGLIGGIIVKQLLKLNFNLYF
jgi:hypothetical protein